MENDIEQQNSEASTSSLTMAELTELETLPEVKENAIQAVANTNAEIQQQNEVEAPLGFNKDGSPKKKRGRKAGSASAPKTAFNFGMQEQQQQAEVSAALDVKDSKAAAAMASGIIETATIALISKGWVLSKEERIENQLAWEKAFDHYGGVELSPPLMLVGSHMRIIMSRAMGDSETKSRMGLAVAWVKHKFTRRKRDARAPDEFPDE